MPQKLSLTRDLPPSPIADWASQPDKFGNLGKQPAAPVQPISANDLMSPETQSLMNDDPWQRLGNLADAAWERMTGKPTVSTLDAGVGSTPRYSTVDQQIGMMPWGPKGFFSHAENVLNDTKQGIFTGNQLKGYLKSKGVKDEELKWSGLGELANQPKVTKAEAMATLAKAPRVSEVRLGSNIDEIRAAETRAYEAGLNHTHIDSEFSRQHGNTMTDWPHEAQKQWLQSADEADQARAEVDRLGDQRSAQYDSPQLKLPGPSSNYQEILLQHEETNPHAKPLQDWPTYDSAPDNVQQMARDDYRSANGLNANTNVASTPPKFTGGHYDEPNVLAHLRLNERPTVDGELASHSDEYQSDWGNQARKNGIKQTYTNLTGGKRTGTLQVTHDASGNYHPPGTSVFQFDDPRPVTENQIPEYHTHVFGFGTTREGAHANALAYVNASGNGVEPAPYIEGSWPELAVKRHLLEAARNPDVKHVTWTTGQQQAERYSLDKHFSRIEHTRLPSGHEQIRAWQQGSNIPTIDRAIVPERGDSLEDYVGQELATRLRAQTPEALPQKWSGAEVRTLMAHDMKVENAGKRQFYDKIMPQTMKKLTKQEPRMLEIQGQLRTDRGRVLGPEKQKVWSIPMTDSLRESILKKGFPLYSIVPPALMIGASRLLPPPPDTQ